MTPALNEDLVQRVNDLGSTSWSGTTYRHVSGRRDPLSGDGARQFGGRWNQPGFAAIYLALPVGTCLAEMDRLAESQGVTAADLLRAVPGRTLHTVEVHALNVLDLRAETARSQVGLDLADISDSDRTACQAVGQSAYFLQFGGVLAPSATGTGLVLTVFEPRVAAGQLIVAQSTTLTEARYLDLTEQ